MSKWIKPWVGVVVLLAGCGADRSEDGARLFDENCVICHGADARGGGGAGVVGLSKTPSDLTVLSRNNDGVFPTRDVAQILQDYARGDQIGRRMTPLAEIGSNKLRRVKTQDGRIQIARPQAAIIAFLNTVQRP